MHGLPEIHQTRLYESFVGVPFPLRSNRTPRKAFVSALGDMYPPGSFTKSTSPDNFVSWLTPRNFGWR